MVDEAPVGLALRHRRLSHGRRRVSDLAWSPDGRRLAVTRGFEVELWDGLSGTRLDAFHWGNGEIKRLAWSPDGERLAGGVGITSYRASVLVWKLGATEPVEALEGPPVASEHTAEVSDLAWSGDGSVLAVAFGSPKYTWLWDTEIWKPVKKLKNHPKGIVLAGVRGANLLVASFGPEALVIRVPGAEIVQRFPAAKTPLTGVAISPDGCLVAGATEKGAIWIWERVRGEKLAALRGHERKVCRLGFSADGRLLASKSSDGTVRLWETDGWTSAAVLPEDSAGGYASALALHPQEPVLASLEVGEMGVRIWNLDPAQLLPARRRGRKSRDESVLGSGTMAGAELARSESGPAPEWDETLWGGHSTLNNGVLGVFREQGLTDLRQLERRLDERPESAADSYLYGQLWTGEVEIESHPIGDALHSALTDVARRLDALYESLGIQQVALHPTEPLELVVKRALFLCRTTTVVTDHSFTYRSSAFVSDLGDEIHDYSWHYDHRFIRELFRYREALEEGALVLLPDSLQFRMEGRRESPAEGTEPGSLRVLDLGSDLGRAVSSTTTLPAGWRPLPEVQVPWIENLDLGTILKVRRDHGDLLEDFQGQYRKAISTYAAHRPEVDFSRLSREIHEDLVLPAVSRLERKYRRILSLHGKLEAAGAAVSSIPLAATLVGGGALEALMTGELRSLLGTTLAALVGNLATNLIQKRHKIAELDDQEFFLVWKLLRRGR